MKKINKCKRHDGEGDSDHGVLISGKVPQEAGSMKTDGHMVHQFPYEASLTTRNPFMRWLSVCNATNLGLMKNTGATCQRWGLSTIPKRISESPDVSDIEFVSAVLIPTGLLKRCLMGLCGVYREFYIQQIHPVFHYMKQNYDPTKTNKLNHPEILFVRYIQKSQVTIFTISTSCSHFLICFGD